MNDMSNSLAAGFLASVAAAGDSITPKDQALVDLGVRYAIRIDAGIDEGGQAATKALYLGPHLVNVCRELGLSPSARGAVAVDPADGGGAKVTDELAAMRRRSRGGA